VNKYAHHNIHVVTQNMHLRMFMVNVQTCTHAIHITVRCQETNSFVQFTMYSMIFNISVLRNIFGEILFQVQTKQNQSARSKRKNTTSFRNAFVNNSVRFFLRCLIRLYKIECPHLSMTKPFPNSTITETVFKFNWCLQN